jgi:hypothetical protein
VITDRFVHRLIVQLAAGATSSTILVRPVDRRNINGLTTGLKISTGVPPARQLAALLARQRIAEPVPRVRWHVAHDARIAEVKCNRNVSEISGRWPRIRA